MDQEQAPTQRIMSMEEMLALEQRMINEGYQPTPEEYAVVLASLRQGRVSAVAKKSAPKAKGTSRAMSDDEAAALFS